jgi:hypothetical protein
VHPVPVEGYPESSLGLFDHLGLGCIRVACVDEADDVWLFALQACDGGPEDALPASACVAEKWETHTESALVKAASGGGGDVGSTHQYG